MIKAIIFDINGVLINDAGPLSSRLEEKFGIPATETYPLIKTTLHQVREPGINSRPLWQPLLDKLNLSYDELFKFWFEGESLNGDLLQFAKELKQKGIKIVVLSNNFPERTSSYRQRFPELFEVIDEQYFSWETGHIKPHPDAFAQILAKHSFLPSEYVYLDNSDENLDAAAQMGIVSHKYVDVADTKQFITTHSSI